MKTGLCGSGEHRGKRDARALSAQLRCGVHGQRPFNSGLTEQWLTEQWFTKQYSTVASQRAFVAATVQAYGTGKARVQLFILRKLA